MNRGKLEELIGKGHVTAYLSNHAIERMFGRSSNLDLIMGDYVSYDSKQRVLVRMPILASHTRGGNDGAFIINWVPFGEFVVKKDDDHYVVITYYGLRKEGRHRKIIHRARRTWVNNLNDESLLNGLKLRHKMTEWRIKALKKKMRARN